MFRPVNTEPQYLKYSKNEIDRINNEAASYNKNVESYRQLDKEKTSELEEFDTVLSPLLLAIAAAVAGMKTSCEIRNANRKHNFRVVAS